MRPFCFTAPFPWRKIIVSALLVAFCLCGNADEPAEEDPLRTAATSGDVQAQFKLGTEYFYGSEQREVNLDLAAYWFLQAAAKGLPEAQLNYAICLENGLGVPADPKTALEFYTFAAEAGSVPAKYNLALLLLYGTPKDSKLDESKKVHPDEAKAKKLLEELSEKKFAPAMAEFAAVLLNPTNIDQATREKAFSLLREASSMPNATAKGFRMLSDCWYGGIGTPKNVKKAFEALQAGAKLGDAETIAKLAFFYESGEACEPDKQKAFELYRLAAEKNYPYAQYKYAEYILEEREPGKGLDAALELYRKAARQKCPQAIFKLGMFEMEGIGKDQPDKPAAAEYFLIAAEAGYPPAQYALACMFFSGDGIPQDSRKAFFWFAQASVRGHGPAMRRLAMCYYEGAGCIKDSEKGDQWLKAAADTGDFTAQRMIETGRRTSF